MNPTVELVNGLSDKLGEFARIETLKLSVSFENSFLELSKLIASFNPSYVFSFGVAIKRKKICLEKRAENLIKSSKADISGVVPISRKVSENGPDILNSCLDWENTLDALPSSYREHVKLSDSAGSYVCNAHFYSLLNNQAQQSYRGAFIHIPPLEVISLKKQVDIIGYLIEDILKRT